MLPKSSKAFSFITILFFACISGTRVSAATPSQSNDRVGENIFDDTEKHVFGNEVHKIVVKVLRSTHNKVLSEAANENARSGHIKQLEFYARMDSTKPILSIYNASYKVKGNNSAWREPKRQFSISFDETEDVFEKNGQTLQLNSDVVKKQNLFGLKSIALRSGGVGTNDDTIAREKLASDIFSVNQSSVRGPLVYRVGYAQLLFRYCSDEDWQGLNCNDWEDKGLYYIGEQIDETFVNTRYQKSAELVPGVLVKSVFENNENRADFEKEHTSAKSFKVKYSKLTSSDVPDFLLQDYEKILKDGDCGLPVLQDGEISDGKRKGFALLCATVNYVSENPNFNAINSLFDISSLARYATAMNFTSHWDSFLGNANNDFLFFDGFTKKWTVIAWDLDLTFGNQCHPHCTNREALRGEVRTKNKLFEILFASPEFRTIYSTEQNKMLQTPEGAINKTRISMLISKLENLVKSHITSYDRDSAINFEWAFDFMRTFVNQRDEAIRAKPVQ